MPELDALIERAIVEKKLPGCVVVAGNRDGIRYQKAFGARSLLPGREAMTLDTLFDLASLTKPVATASAVMRLVEMGKLRLDDRVAQHVPEFAAGGKGQIRVRDLMLHGAGLPRVNALREYDAGPDAAMRAILGVRPLYPLHQKYLYSDLDFIVLGELVRRVSGQQLDAFVQEQLFEPLGMGDTGFGVEEGRRARAAPTELRDEKWIRGVVHDPRAFRLGGVAGHAGLFSTGQDLARFARMLLAQGTLDGRRVLSPASVQALGRPASVGDTVRTLGWDMHSDYARLRGALLSERAFGHGGFTGTSLWIDPDRDLFLIFLSNRVHPDGTGNAIGLAADVASALTAAFDRAARPAVCELGPGHTVTGIDALEAEAFASLAGRRIALLTNDAACDRAGRRSLDVLHETTALELVRVFSPEHGLAAHAEGAIDDARDAATGLPVHSLFGPTRRPTPAMLEGLDTVVFDLQDAGVRYFTYMSTLLEVMQAAAARGLEVVVLDRPNPLGDTVEGPLLDRGIKTFVNYHSLPVRHGMSVGELARLLAAERGLALAPSVVPMTEHRRDFLWQDTGLTWHPPSPNLTSPSAALLYPLTGLLEGTNLSVGRGTPTPFEVLGAPWLDARALLQRLQAAELDGVTLSLTELQPASDRYRGERFEGLSLSVQDARAYRPIGAALRLAQALHAQHPTEWQALDLNKLLGHGATLRGLYAGVPVAELEARHLRDDDAFRARRLPHLLYPSCTPAGAPMSPVAHK